MRATKTLHDWRSIFGFTLIEVLVVLAMILIVSAVALPTVLPALSHRQVSEAARLLQAEIVGARDKAIRSNAPCGLRLLPDPAIPINRITSTSNPSVGQIDTTQPLVANRIVALEGAPDYSEGKVYAADVADPRIVGLQLPYPGPNSTSTSPAYYPMFNVRVVVEQLYDTNTSLANPPTSWFWNIRVGDKLQFGSSGPWYTVVGPMTWGPSAGNSEMFVNVRAPGTQSPLQEFVSTPQGNAIAYPEFLLIVNGQDDNANGMIDEGWDGIDNDGVNGVDDVGEWESETWVGALSNSSNASVPYHDLTYTIRRRPVPASTGREVALPSNVVVDLTTGISNIAPSGVASTTSQERSRLPVNPYTGFVDIMVNPDGSVLPTSIYSNPASFGMGNAFYHFWLGERADVVAPNPTAKSAPYLPIPLPAGVSGSSVTYSVLKGEYRLLTLFTRSGVTAVNQNMVFDNPNKPQTGKSYNVNLPFIQAQQGVVGGF